MTGPPSGILLDSNILIYPYDISEKRKGEQARDVLMEIAGRSAGVVSTQVLAEFFSNITRKLKPPVPIDAAIAILADQISSWRVINHSPAILLEAAQGVRTHQLSWWDAQIWAAAKLSDIPVVFSDDFSHGQVIGGVRFVNPFAKDFLLSDWL